MDKLLQKIRACTLCHDLPLGPNPIIQFNPTAKILVAGQAPGRITHHKNRPFDDPSGNRLRQWMGISRETFYDERKLAIIPMGFCYPGTSKSGDLPPRPLCAETWRQQLMDRLPHLELTLVIGRYAASWHIKPDNTQVNDKQTLTQVIQNWQEYFPTLLPLPHPSPRNNRWLKNNPWFEQDVIPTLQHRVKTILGH